MTQNGTDGSGLGGGAALICTDAGVDAVVAAGATGAARLVTPDTLRRPGRPVLAAIATVGPAVPGLGAGAASPGAGGLAGSRLAGGPAIDTSSSPPR